MPISEPIENKNILERVKEYRKNLSPCQMGMVPIEWAERLALVIREANSTIRIMQKAIDDRTVCGICEDDYKRVRDVILKVP